MELSILPQIKMARKTDEDCEHSLKENLDLKPPMLRPVLEHRMPTLVTKANFSTTERYSAFTGGGTNCLKIMIDSPPHSMKDLRSHIRKETEAIQKKIVKMERAYYGRNGGIGGEIERYAGSIKSIMKVALTFELNSAAAVEKLISVGMNPSRYIGEPKHIADLKEVYTKIKNFLPSKVPVLVDSVQLLLENVSRYCVSFYEPGSDYYLETADHYSEQISSWKEKVIESIQSSRNMYKKFLSGGITNINMLSPPVATFTSRASLQRLLFLVLFADAMTHLRNALDVIKIWVKADENYVTYVRNDLVELENFRDERTRNFRDLRQKFHSLTFRLNQLENESTKLQQEVTALKKKEENLRIEEVSLVNQITDLEREFEIKEKKKVQLRKNSPSRSPSPRLELYDTYETLSTDIKAVKDKLPVLTRQLAGVRLKLSWVDEKSSSLTRINKEIQNLRNNLSQIEQDRTRKEKEYQDNEKTVYIARRIVLLKTSNDSVEKLYYSVPVVARSDRKIVKSKDAVKDPVEKASRIIARRIEGDWVQLYRNLPFHPIRGDETISKDIVDLMISDARSSSIPVAKKALDRWRRYHTRANVDDLRQALKKAKRLDIVKVIDLDLSPPPKVVETPLEAPEESIPPVAPHLIPFYRQIERYDQIRASKQNVETAETTSKKLTTVVIDI